MGIREKTADFLFKAANRISTEKKATNNLNAQNKEGRDIGENEYNAKIITSQAPNPQGGFSYQDLKESIIKAYMPDFLYRPPFGYPRKDNIYQLDILAKNPYVFSVNKAIQEEVANMSWDIKLKEDYIDKTKIDGESDADSEEHNQADADPEARQFLIDFLNNPNGNDESFTDLVKMAINDIVRYDAGVWVKVFNKRGELREIYARKGGSFLKNTTIFGTMHERADIVLPLNDFWRGLQAGMTQQKLTERSVVDQYHSIYSERAAYFQYGQNYQTFPVPFGRREIAYMSMNPQSDTIYGISPLQMLYDTILTLVYGGKYNLDFYSQNNMPEGLISLQGADPDEVQRYKAQFENNVREKDEFGMMRKKFFKMLFTTSPSEFIPFNMKPADMQILEQQRYFHRLVMMCFGMSENELGVVEDVNRANGEVQFKITNRRAILPYLRKIENVINNQIFSEFSFAKGWEFKFNLYDLEEDIRKHDLYEKQINMGIKTNLMVAEEEGIDIDALKEAKEQAKENTLSSSGEFPQEEQVGSGSESGKEEEQEMPTDKQQPGNYSTKSTTVSDGNVPHETKVSDIDIKSANRRTNDLSPLIDAVERTYEYIDEKLSQFNQDQEI